MKKFFKMAGSLVLAVVLLSTLAYASMVSPLASQYLTSYDASISAGSNGSVSVNAKVQGTGGVTKIGVSRITVYESADGESFSVYGNYYSGDYPSMMTSGNYYNQKALTFTGTIGNVYKATVYCYASDGSGGDTKSVNTGTVTAKR